jgi:hypothetical protein
MHVIRTHIHIYPHTCPHTHTHTYTHVHTHVHTHTHTYPLTTHTHMYTTRADMHTYIHTIHIYTFTFARTHRSSDVQASTGVCRGRAGVLWTPGSSYLSDGTRIGVRWWCAAQLAKRIMV